MRFVAELLLLGSSDSTEQERRGVSVGKPERKLGQFGIPVASITFDDVLIQPRLGQLKMMDFDQVEQTIEEGYISVKEKIEEINKNRGIEAKIKRRARPIT